MSPTENFIFANAPEGAVAFATLGDHPPLLGTVTHLELPDGERLPTFSLWSHECHLPLIELNDEPATATRFSLAGFTLTEYMADPHRQQLAKFYQVACQRFGWVRDEHATLNVIYRLEQAGIREIGHDNLRRAMNVAHAATQAVYAYVRQFAKMKLAA